MKAGVGATALGHGAEEGRGLCCLTSRGGISDTHLGRHILSSLMPPQSPCGVSRVWTHPREKLPQQLLPADTGLTPLGHQSPFSGLGLGLQWGQNRKALAPLQWGRHNTPKRYKCIQHVPFQGPLARLQVPGALAVQASMPLAHVGLHPGHVTLEFYEDKGSQCRKVPGLGWPPGKY